MLKNFKTQMCDWLQVWMQNPLPDYQRTGEYASINKIELARRM